MRWRPLLAAALGACVSVCALAEEFPYTAYVNSADVYVRSGPGRDYYPTDKLVKGQKVEIYRHDPGGWYAIRPPRGSFAWVSKRHLEPDRDGLATVVMPRAVARVGSAFSDARDVIQVRLDKGEKVELLESPSDDSTWYKIAPPAGEFRWVFSKFVDREIPGDVAERARSDQDVRLASGSLEESNAGNEGGGLMPVHSSQRSITDRELDGVDLELSAMVTQDISQWSFGELQRRTEEILRTAGTSIERGRARVLLTKLARFDDIKGRHEALRATGSLAVPSRDARGAVAPAPVDTSRYDGVGRLSPVISEKVGGPQFALVDANNAVVSFVTPAPGVNLRPYVDRYVGVNGQSGYMANLQRQHINVQRVTVLDVQRR
jgi:hypothetical protein